MRVLIDTNVLVSALLLPGSLPRQVVDLCLDRSDLISSIELVMELDEVLSRPKIAAKTEPVLAGSFVDAYKRASILVEVATAVEVCRDPKDNHVLAAALDGHADLIITGDADLLILDPFRGVRILTPADAASVLTA